MIRNTFLCLAALICPVAVGAAPGEIERVETGLLPPVTVVGKPTPRMPLTERMKHYRVPAVGIALIEGYKTRWSRTYGVHTPGGTLATSRTLFQAASISKPIAAAAALKLVFERRLALDAPANGYLSTWRVPDSEAAPAASVTLRRLLSHSAGLSVSGFDGYAPGKPLPSLRQLLNGASPANSEPVRIVQAPGRWRYSGGGYSVVQQMIENVTRRPFAAALKSSVLAPLGMTDSSFEQPLPKAREHLAAIGHQAKGEAVDGGWHVYPELAAAGLWTTPTDLARFATWVLQGVSDRRASPVQRFVATQLTEAQPGLDAGGGENMGLGLFLRGEGQALQFRHAGGNAGYNVLLVVFPKTGQGAVIMLNGEAPALIPEILRALAMEYGWPTKFHEMVVPARLERSQLVARAGTYGWGPKPNEQVTFATAGDTLTARVGSGEPAALVPADPQTFFNPTSGLRFRFESDRVSIEPPSGAPRTATRRGVTDASTKGPDQ